MTSHGITLLLVDLALIILLARGLGALARLLHQPAVIGEVLAGIFVLPVLINIGVARGLFPGEVRVNLSALANVGVALFMFIVGMELDRDLVRGRGKLAVSVAIASMALPLGLGIGLGFYLSGTHSGGSGTTFVLFMGVAMAITAFPVLARILTDRGMSQTPVGSLALTCAAIGDVLAWLLLAMVVTLSGHKAGDQWQVLLLAPYLVVMVTMVRPLLRKLADSDRVKPVTLLAAVVAGALLSGAATEWMGLHFIFGAFMFGTIMPTGSTRMMRGYVHARIAELNGVLLLPVFFIVAGLKVNLSEFGTTGLKELGLILAVAMLGKFGGAYVTARFFRMPSRQATTLGILMNTRGLTELIVLTVGLEFGLIDTRLYTLLVIMAIVTTAMAGPLLWLVYPAAQVRRDTKPRERVEETAGVA